MTLCIRAVFCLPRFPRGGTVLTLGLAPDAVMTGNLNVIAPLLTMFFLTTYAVLNVAAGVEGFLDSPSFRPEFEVHWSLSLLGAAGCIGVMFLINWWAPLIRNPADQFGCPTSLIPNDRLRKMRSAGSFLNSAFEFGSIPSRPRLAVSTVPSLNC